MLKYAKIFFNFYKIFLFFQKSKKNFLTHLLKDKNSFYPLPSNGFDFFLYIAKDYAISSKLYILCALLSGLSVPILGFIIKKIIDFLPYVHEDISVLYYPVFSIILVLIFFQYIPFLGFHYIVKNILPSILSKTYTQIVSYSMRKSQSSFEEHQFIFLKEISTLIKGIEKVFNFHIFNFLKFFSFNLIICTLILFINYSFLKYFLLLYLIFFVFCFFTFPMIEKISEAKDKQKFFLEKNIMYLSDSMHIFQNKEKYHKEEKILLSSYRKLYRQEQHLIILLNLLQGILLCCFMIFNFFLLLEFYKDNKITMGNFVFFIFIIIETSRQFYLSLNNLYNFFKIINFFNKSLQFFFPQKNTLEEKKQCILNTCSGKITFSHVKFFYKEDNFLLSNISLTIKAGQKVGLIGCLNDEKNAFMNLLLGNEFLKDGSIFLDNVDIKDLTEKNINNLISNLSEELSLIHGKIFTHKTIYDNLCFGKNDLTEKNIEEAAKKTKLHDFVSTLPKGYFTIIEESQIKTSKEQYENLLMTRLILKDAPIVLIDETRCQDTSLNELYEFLGSFLKKKTVIVNINDFSTALKMDRLLVFDKGRIIQDGRHDALMMQLGLYRNLFDSKFS